LDQTGQQPQSHAHAPSHLPVGVAIGVGCALVGLLVSWWLVAIGAAIAVLFGMLWVYDVMRVEEPEAPAGDGPPEAGAHVARSAVGAQPATRKGFLAATTIGLGAAIGAIVTVPSLVFAGVPPFRKGEGFIDMEVDLGPLASFKQDEWLITKFNVAPEQGDVANRTAYVRFNGLLEGKPSFTILSNRCVHLGCPVQANGPVGEGAKEFGAGRRKVAFTPVLPAGFGCPCHGGQYDTEGNRTAGPPVRALDRYAYEIRGGNVVLVGAFSVNEVEGTGMDANIGKYRLAQPGVHVDGVEQILYPFIPPS
jgi:Rieske Fe-S protein